MGGPGSGRRKGNPAENRKKKAKTKLLTVRMWDWQYDKVAADAEAAGVNISEHTLNSLEVSTMKGKKFTVKEKIMGRPDYENNEPAKPLWLPGEVYTVTQWEGDGVGMIECEASTGRQETSCVAENFGKNGFFIPA